MSRASCRVHEAEAYEQSADYYGEKSRQQPPLGGLRYLKGRRFVVIGLLTYSTGLYAVQSP